jgi:GGDEF domain-containing protein
LRGDDVITMLAATLKQAGAELVGPQPFIGHVGGDDFVIICEPDQVETLTGRVITLFDENVTLLHDPDDVRAGSIAIVDRQGNERRYPLVSVSIGVAMTGRRRYNDYRAIVAVATEMKAVAKGQMGSAVAIDRRTDPVEAPSAAPPVPAAAEE